MNKVILFGRLTKDPETTVTPSGVSVSKFNLAVNRRFQKQGEERQADFINIVTFNKTAEFVQKYFTKGQAALICGSIQTRNYEKDGQKIYVTEVIAEEVNFGSAKKDDNTVSGSDALDELRKSGNDFISISGDDDCPF